LAFFPTLSRFAKAPSYNYVNDASRYSQSIFHSDGFGHFRSFQGWLMRQERFVIYRASSFAEASRHARAESARRDCSCVVRRDSEGAFVVFACQEPPIGALKRLALEAEVIAPGSHLHVLRRYCLTSGLSQAGWKFVSAHGEAALRASRQRILGASRQFECALHLIEWQAAARLEKPLPGILAEQYVLAMGVLLADSDSVDPRLARAAAWHWEALGEESRRTFARNEWLRIIVWMRDHSPQLDKNQWRAGWPAISRAFERWAIEQPTQSEWESPVDRLRIGNYRVKALNSALELARDGQAMRTCVASYAGLCRAGGYLVYSVFSLEESKRVATIGLELGSDGWELEQVKARFNARPSDEVNLVAERLVDNIQGVEPEVAINRTSRSG
jgi:hypothetical protein